MRPEITWRLVVDRNLRCSHLSRKDIHNDVHFNGQFQGERGLAASHSHLFHLFSKRTFMTAQIPPPEMAHVTSGRRGLTCSGRERLDPVIQKLQVVVVGCVVTISPECRGVTSDRRTAPRPHYADLTTAPLAARTSTSHFQDRRPGLSVSDRPGTRISGRRLSAYFRRQYAPTPID